MAKKNSSKTATEKAIQSSEPRVINYRGWKGVNFVDAPLTWDPLETGPDKFRQTDLPANFLMVQNNLNTTDTLGLETRQDSIDIGDVPDGWKFTGVSAVFKHWLFCAVRNSDANGNQSFNEHIVYRDLKASSTTTWTTISLGISGVSGTPANYAIEEIGFFEGNIVATLRHFTSAGVANEGLLTLAKVETDEDDTTISINGMNWSTYTESRSNVIVDTPEITNPTIKPSLTAVGMKSSTTATTTAPVRVEVCFCYTNRLGSTLTNADVNSNYIATIYTELSPALWTSKKYLRIQAPSNDTRVIPGSSITGIDIYARDTENIDWVFAGHLDVKPVAGGVRWAYNWYGNMTDITQWTTSQLMVPSENTTHGPDASHFSCHDSRIYYWGMPSKPYRLWIGGNPGSEFSIARGLGGAWVDIEPGSGYDIKGTAKWKTTSGANIVTIMCGNRNTTKIKRFNLVETNLTLTNEVAYKSYMYEEVSNVVGCNSRWGYGVFTDGLYSLNRYGLMLTTMAMEYNAQMKNQKMSSVIDPIFTERLGKRLRDGRMVCIDDIIYIALSEDEQHGDEPIALDNVILCYDIDQQAWYTWTHDQTYGARGSDPDKILHILAIDSDEFDEGLGAITETQVRLYPVTGVQGATPPEFQVLMESGELVPRLPKQAMTWIEQLEFRFDYLITPEETDNYNRNDATWPTILVEGIDYYGRQFTIEKKLNIKSRGNDRYNITGERRNYVEWVRVNKYCESLRIRLKGRARFRLTHINCKMYQQADVIGTPYGYDAYDSYRNRKGGSTKIHHYINDYNNLREAVIA